MQNKRNGTKRFLSVLLALVMVVGLIPGGTVAVAAGSSYYTVEFTYGTMTYELPGDSEVKLSDVLSYIRLSGEVTAASGSNDELFSVSNEGGEWVIHSHRPFNTEEKLSVTINGIVYEITVTDAVEVNSWAGLQAAFTNGDDVKLSGNIVAGSSDLNLVVPADKDVILDLAGYKIDRNPNVVDNYGMAIYLYGGLTITDTVGGGMITGGKCLSAGGAIHVSTGNLTMKGGTISGNTAARGAGVYVYRGTFTMEGGNINDNSGQGGAGVFVDEGTFIMKGGKISDNSAAKFGAGVYIYKGTFNMSGSSEISGNITSASEEAGGYGGGVYLWNPVLFAMDGGKIIDNETSADGGGVYIIGGPMPHMKGNVKITGNKSGGADSNLFIPEHCYVILDGELTGGASSIGVTTEILPSDDSPVSFATASDPSTSPWLETDAFTSDKSRYVVERTDSGPLALFLTKFTITFDPNGGSASETNATTGTDGKLASLPTATRDGYSFMGWFTSPNDGSKISTETVFTENTTVYAHWQINLVDFAELETELTFGKEFPNKFGVTAPDSHCKNTIYYWEDPWGNVASGIPEEGRYYWLNVYIEPDAGYTFGPVGTKVPVYRNGEKLGDGEVVSAYGRDEILRFQLRRTGPHSVAITRVDFSSLTTTLASGFPETPTAVLAPNSHCGITYLGKWLERVSGGYYTGTAGQGMTYYYNLEFEPDTGYTFGEAGTKIPVYLNGTKLGDAEVEKRGSTVKLYYTVSYTVPITGLPINDENFPDPWFQDYIKEYIDTEADGYLTDAERLAVTEIDIDNCDNQSYYWMIGSLEGIYYFPNLEILYCGSGLKTLDLSQNTKLKEVYLNNNDAGGDLTSLNLKGCTQLETLSLFDNQVTYLDLTTNTKLKELNVDGNKLTSLDLSKNTLLENLYIGGNAELISLDLSKNKELRSLAINNTGIKSIDLSALSKLDYFRCDHCGLTTLDLTKNPALTRLDCSYNNLTALDVTHNPKLSYIDCRYNALTGLNISTCPALDRLNCVANKLTALNLSQNPALSQLSCYGNGIKALDIASCPKLMGAYTGSYHPERSEEINGKTVTYIFYSASGGVLAVEKGVKVVTAPIVGDLNRNGLLDPGDAALYFRYASGDTAAVSTPVPDLTGDGKRTTRDAFALFRRVA